MDIEELKKYFLEHPATIISVIFLFSSATGIFYDFFYYSNFQLNILDYSNAEDYLLSWLRDGNMILNSTFVLLFFYVTFKTHLMVNTERYLNQSKEKILKRKNNSKIILIAFYLLIIIHSTFFAKLYQYSFYTTILLFIISKIFDMRVYIFKSILNGRLIHIKIERQLMYFIIIWTTSVCWTAISTANYIKHSNIVYYSIELRDTVLRDVKLIGKNSTYSFLSLSTDSTIKIINNEEILSYTKKIK